MPTTESISLQHYLLFFSSELADAAKFPPSPPLLPPPISAVSGRGAGSGIILFRFLLSRPFTNLNARGFYVAAATSRLGDGLLLKMCLCCGQVWLQHWLPGAGWGVPLEWAQKQLVPYLENSACGDASEICSFFSRRQDKKKVSIVLRSWCLWLEIATLSGLICLL